MSISEIGSFIVINHQALITGLLASLSGIIMIALVIPGEQPEKFLQKMVDIISKFSRK